jgi:DNA primase
VRHNAVAEIKEHVTVSDVLRKCGHPTNIRRRIPCPIHSGKNANFGYDDRVFHCFVCGAKGDVIRLTELLCGLSFVDAVKKLNDDFRLGITTEKPDYRTQKRLRFEARIRRSEEKEQEDRRREYLRMCKLHAVLYRQSLLEPEDAELAAYIDRLDSFLDLLSMPATRRTGN